MGSVFLCVSLALAAPQRPEIPSLSTQEQAVLERREVVVQVGQDAGATRSTGLVLTTAAAEAAWREINDIPGRKALSSTLTEVSEYARSGPNQWSDQIGMDVFGIGLRFHLQHTYAPSQAWMWFTLDTTKTNDLTRCDGWWRVEERGGQRLMVYQITSKPGVWAPGWVMEWMAKDSMIQILTQIRDKIEAR